MMMIKKGCKMNPFIQVNMCWKTEGTNFIFNPECTCKDCKALKKEFMIIAERIRRRMPVREAVEPMKCYYHKKEDLDYCSVCVKEHIKRKIEKGELKEIKEK